jgi:hypothetical protein
MLPCSDWERQTEVTAAFFSMACLQQMRLGASIWRMERETGELPTRNSLPEPMLTRRVKNRLRRHFSARR